MLGFRPILGLVDTASHAERPASSKARCALSQRLRIYLFQAHAHHRALCGQSFQLSSDCLSGRGTYKKQSRGRLEKEANTASGQVPPTALQRLLPPHSVVSPVPPSASGSPTPTSRALAGHPRLPFFPGLISKPREVCVILESVSDVFVVSCF